MTVSKARAQLPKLLKKHSFAISRHGKVIGVYLSRERIEALIETVELLSDSGFRAALNKYNTGKTRLVDIDRVRW